MHNPIAPDWEHELHRRDQRRGNVTLEYYREGSLGSEGVVWKMK